MNDSKNTKWYKCNRCNKLCSTRRGMAFHVSTQHHWQAILAEYKGIASGYGNPGAANHCVWCRVAFPSRYKFVRHLTSAHKLLSQGDFDRMVSVCKIISP